MTDDTELRILGVIARGRARRLAAHDAAVSGEHPSTEPPRDELARRCDRAQRELARTRRRGADEPVAG